MSQTILFARNLKPTFRRAFFAFFGNDADSVGFVAQGDLLHFLSRGHLKIQRNAQNFHQSVNVITDAPVFAWVRGDTVGTCRPAILAARSGSG